MVDEFFDCLNTRSFDEHICKRKPALAPYRDVNDPRFQVNTILVFQQRNVGGGGCRMGDHSDVWG